MKIYAIYKGENFLYEGTSKECAEYFKVKESTVSFWHSPSNKKRDKRNNRKIAIIIGEE